MNGYTYTIEYCSAKKKKRAGGSNNMSEAEMHYNKQRKPFSES